MNMPRMILGLGLNLIEGGSVLAAGIPVPSDISVAFTAEPNVNLQSGQRVNFTLSVTNHGPDPVNRLALGSSPIYDELDVSSYSSSGCDGALLLGVVDLENSFYYLYAYQVVGPDSPMAVGETRTCRFSLDFTQWAPPVFSLTFDMRTFDDLDPSNNAATVVLRRAVVAPTTVPSSSPAGLGLLVLVLLVTAWKRQTRSNVRSSKR
ncbi:MAG: hypothetical protein ABIQ70_06390 [Dokdonella sp.]